MSRWTLSAAGVPAEEAAHDKNGACFLADTPDTRLTQELLVIISAELLSDSETLDATYFVVMLRELPS